MPRSSSYKARAETSEDAPKDGEEAPKAAPAKRVVQPNVGGTEQYNAAKRKEAEKTARLRALRLNRDAEPAVQGDKPEA